MFRLHSEYIPKGEQTKAIEKLVEAINVFFFIFFTFYDNISSDL